MKSEIHIIHGEGLLEDKRSHVVEQLQGERTLVLLPEIDNYHYYKGFNRNIQIGLSSDAITIPYLEKHGKVVVEPYDYIDFKAFLATSSLLKDFLQGYNQTMYIICNEQKELTIRLVEDLVEMREESLGELWEIKPKLKDIILSRKY